MIDNKKLEHSVEKIKLARGKGDMKLAERLCLQALQDDPVNLTILFQLSDIYFAGGNYTETVQVLKKIIGTGVKNPEIQTALGLALHKSGDIDAALREYSLAVEMDPANRARLDQVWKAAWEGGQFQLGADFLLKKLQLKQDEPFDWYNLSIIYTQIHDLPKARKAIEYAIEYKNDDPRFYSLLLTICQAEKSHEEALVICRRLLELEPQELRHYVNSGYFLARMKKTTEALELFKMAREIDPDNELVIRNCYHAMLKLGDYTNGFALFEKRLQSKELAPLFEKFADIPRWGGEVLGDKKLLVHCEQGFGDAIQFVRFLPMVTSRATNIVFLVPGAL